MQIETLMRLEELTLQANERHALDHHTPALILDDKVVSIEHLQEGRSRFRGSLKTSLLAEFVAYLKRHTGGAGFIDADNMTATAFLNLGSKEDPGHADWQAHLDLKATAAYRAIRSIEGSPLSQKQMAEWIEDWSTHMSAVKDGAAIGISTALAAIREISIEAKKNVTSTDRDFGASRSSMEEIEARAKGGLPTHLQFGCHPYPGFRHRDFNLRLSVITGDSPALKLRIVGKEQVEEDIAQEFKALLLEEIGESAELTIGTFRP
ncbi:MAG: DUF2303 family protein [Polycyclovorans sp.]|nr:DUF2303 family protein [Polycyclovorans sp.]